MFSFKEFLAEAFDSQHVGHLTHFEDAGHESGHHGADNAITALHRLHDHILHGKHDSNLTTKVDGGVSVVAGKHPINGKNFVAYKGAINKIGTGDEKGVCYSHSDVDKHFKDKPYLKDKMKTTLDHAHKILPEHGVFQGDLLHAGQHEVKHKGDKVSLTPNTITYSAKKSSTEGKKIADSKLGVSFHTKYTHYDRTGLHAEPVHHGEFKHHDDVYHLSTSNDTSKANYTDEHQAKFAHHMNEASKIHDKVNSHEMYDAIHPHGAHISTYINKNVREGTAPTTEDLKHHIKGHYQKEIGKLKTDAGKSRKSNVRDNVVNHIDANKHHFDDYFKMHHHLTQAKNTLVNVLDHADHPLEHHIEGKKTHPEGYVSYHAGKPFKAVNREEFSKANFAKARD